MEIFRVADLPEGKDLAEIWRKRHKLPLLPYSFRETPANFANVGTECEKTSIKY